VRWVLEPDVAPDAAFVKPHVGVEVGYPSLAGGFETELQRRTAYYESTHLQTIEFEIARVIVGRLLETAEPKMRRVSAHVLFPRVFQLVDEYVRTRVDFRAMHPCELGLSRYADAVAERIFIAIRPDENAGEPPLLPLLNRHRPTGDTSVVNFKTVKRCFATRKSHINLVAADTGSWEQAAAFALEASDAVVAYARNERLEFSIPYEFRGIPRSYFPDFLVSLADDSTLVLEIKGEETEEDRAKHVAADRWVAAVNNWGKLGRWRFRVCRDPQLLRESIDDLVTPVAAGG